MTASFGGVPAAPNRSAIEAKVVRIEQSPEFSDRWHLELEFLSSENISGPNFARVGQTARAFTFEPTSGISPGRTIAAEAEFLGDERGGQFRLTQLHLVD
jgi:hypothetical protein